jgi:cell division protein FtsW
MVFVNSESQVKTLVRERMTGSGLGVDVPLLVTAAALLMAGLITVASTSWGVSFMMSSDNSVWHYFALQCLWAVIGLAFLVALYRVDYHILLQVKWLVVFLAGGTVVALLAVLFLKGDSTTRVGLLGFSVQPSEVAKFVTVIYLAVWLVSKRDLLHDMRLGLVPYASLIAIFSGLIVIEPDYSAAATVVLLGVMMFYFGGGDMRNVGLASVVILAGGIFLAVVIRPQRIEDYINGWRNIREANLHIREALSAMSSGGLFGVGAGASRFKYFSLPAAHTDSVFAVIGEELGFVGALVVVGLFVLLIWRGYQVALKAKDDFGLLLAAGITSWIALETLINVMTILQILPFAGNALPFFSYGGSNLVLTLAGVGLLLNISRQRDNPRRVEASNEVPDLRRRDGRRDLSGSRGGAGAQHPGAG